MNGGIILVLFYQNIEHSTNAGAEDLYDHASSREI